MEDKKAIKTNRIQEKKTKKTKEDEKLIDDSTYLLKITVHLQV